MNLTITPVNVNQTFSQRNQSRNIAQNQNFGAMNVNVRNKPSFSRECDILVDKFLYHVENGFKKIGLNTDDLNKKGYVLDINAKDYDWYGDINASFLDKKGELIQNDCSTSVAAEEQSAIQFVNNIAQKLKYSA